MIWPPSSSATGTSVTRPSISAASHTSFSVGNGFPICLSPSNSAYIAASSLPHVILFGRCRRAVLLPLDIALGGAHAGGVHRPILPGPVGHARLLHPGLRSRAGVLCQSRSTHQGKSRDDDNGFHRSLLLD